LTFPALPHNLPQDAGRLQDVSGRRSTTPARRDMLETPGTSGFRIARPVVECASTFSFEVDG
jgi:hypothetical protein